MIEFSGVDLHDAIILEFVATSHANFLQNACLSLQLVNGKNAKLVFEDCFSVVVSFSQWIDFPFSPEMRGEFRLLFLFFENKKQDFFSCFFQNFFPLEFSCRIFEI